MPNIFAEISASLPNELVEVLSNTARVRIERIVSHGHSSPPNFWYDQPEEEWVLVLRGAALLQFDDETIEMKPGDYRLIPAHRRHRVEWTSPGEATIWLAVHFTA